MLILFCYQKYAVNYLRRWQEGDALSKSYNGVHYDYENFVLF